MSKPSIPKLAHGNYWDWAPMMEALLIKEDLWEVTFDEAGQAGKPISPTGSANSAAVKKWRRRCMTQIGASYRIAALGQISSHFMLWAEHLFIHNFLNSPPFPLFKHLI